MSNETESMRQALELAALGRGLVEPNPMVGCVLLRDDVVVGKGWHRHYGGDHAEVEAIRDAGDRAIGSTCYVTLEPCSHFGKTPPCTTALIEAGVVKVVAAMRDPNPLVAGRGFELLRQAGITVETGLLEDEARRLNAPYLTRLEKGRPWIVAKWAMTLDGKIATNTGSSRWITSPEARRDVHELRSRVDAILIGIGTALQDDPLLTVRSESRPPSDSRRPFAEPLRVVLDSHARLPLDSRLAQTAKDAPVLLAVGPEASGKRIEALRNAGCEVFLCQKANTSAANTTSINPVSTEMIYEGVNLAELLGELAKRDCTNLLVEGGSRIFGTLLDGCWIDEVYAYIAPKLVGGAAAPSPVAGQGVEDMEKAFRLIDTDMTVFGPDWRIRGLVRYEEVRSTERRFEET